MLHFFVWSVFTVTAPLNMNDIYLVLQASVIHGWSFPFLAQLFAGTKHMHYTSVLLYVLENLKQELE